MCIKIDSFFPLRPDGHASSNIKRLEPVETISSFQKIRKIALIGFGGIGIGVGMYERHKITSVALHVTIPRLSQILRLRSLEPALVL